MSKHTPGPWSVEEYGDEDCPSLVIHKDSQSRVCFMATPGSMGDPAKIEADAHLIAAAPELLAALKGALEQCIARHDEQGSTQSEMMEIEHARHAIRKAEGPLIAEERTDG